MLMYKYFQKVSVFVQMYEVVAGVLINILEEVLDSICPSMCWMWLTCESIWKTLKGIWNIINISTVKEFAERYENFCF